MAANTKLAVDTLLRRLTQFSVSFRQEAVRQGLDVPNFIVACVHSGTAPPDAHGICNFPSAPCARVVNGWLRDGALLVGGTTNAILKMADELRTKQPFRNRPGGFQADVLVVDEASMMLFPHFLSLASVVSPTGQVLLAGDNRQLAPISAHDWDAEDRPPMQHYQPFNSAYDAVLRIINEAGVQQDAARQSALTFTFRLPPLIRELISRVYSLDEIVLQGDNREPAVRRRSRSRGWATIWNEPTGLVLVIHSERASRQSNGVEAAIIQAMLEAKPDPIDDSIAIITPHRAQRALVRSTLSSRGINVGLIDTVERIQGGEKPTIIVSGTESDPNAIGAAATFILNLNRANVAFSRTQQRLIVVCAETLLDHIPPELEDYESAMLWKSLRNLCSRQVLATNVQDIAVRVMAPTIRART
jgi:superfamily I DNA and/or RNA helicase